MLARANALRARAQVALAFLKPEILALRGSVVDAYLAAEPGLETYRRELEAIGRRAHTLSKETEAALAALDDTLEAPFTIWQRTMASDLALPPVQDALGMTVEMSVTRHARLIESPNRAVRQRAHTSLTIGLGRHKATLATTLAACVTRNATLARVRGYASAAEMMLAPQGVPVSTYETILDALHETIPHLRRLLRLRQRVLGLDRLYRYDLEAPLDPEPAPPLAFEEAAEHVRASLRPLGDEYGAIIATALAERWVDWADSVGKMHHPGTHHVYAFILAHELGHVGHFELARRRQVFSNYLCSAWFAEAPSALAELLLAAHLLDGAEDLRLRRRVLLQLLSVFGPVSGILPGAHLEQRLYDLGVCLS